MSTTNDYLNLPLPYDPNYLNFAGSAYGPVSNLDSPNFNYAPSYSGGGGGGGGAGGIVGGTLGGAAAGFSVGGPVGAVVGGVVGLVGGLFSNSSAKRAAQRQAEAEQQKLELQQRLYAQQQHYNEPYIAAGKSGLAQLQSLNTPEGRAAFISNYTNSPEYGALSTAARNQQLASAEATGNLASSSTGNRLAGIAPNLALNALGRQTEYDQNLVGIGERAVGRQANESNLFGQRQGQSLENIGTARANQALSGGSALNDIFSGIGGLTSDYYNQQAKREFVKNLYDQRQ